MLKAFSDLLCYNIYIVYHTESGISLCYRKIITFTFHFMCEYIGIRLTGYGKITDY